MDYRLCVKFPHQKKKALSVIGKKCKVRNVHCIYYIFIAIVIYISESRTASQLLKKKSKECLFQNIRMSQQKFLESKELLKAIILIGKSEY